MQPCLVIQVCPGQRLFGRRRWEQAPNLDTSFRFATFCMGLRVGRAEWIGWKNDVDTNSLNLGPPYGPRWLRSRGNARLYPRMGLARRCTRFSSTVKYFGRLENHHVSQTAALPESTYWCHEFLGLSLCYYVWWSTDRWTMRWFGYETRRLRFSVSMRTRSSIHDSNRPNLKIIIWFSYRKINNDSSGCQCDQPWTAENHQLD